MEQEDVGQIWTNEKQELFDKWRGDYMDKYLQFPTQQQEDNEWERLFYMKYLKEINQ